MAKRIAAVLLCAAASARQVAGQNEAATHEIDRLFKDFVRDFEKVYDDVEREVRRKVFKDNYRFIQEENAKGHSYTLGINKFADMTADEFAATHMGLRSPKQPWGGLPNLGTHRVRNVTLPSSVDWRSSHAVTNVKDQGQCGSCWAFSTTGSLEGAWEIATGHLVSLSEQQLVDCSGRFGNEGCNGGLMDSAFRYAEQAALCTEASYRYQESKGHCKASQCAVGIPKGGVVGFKDVHHNDETALMDAVAQQPVSIAIEADRSVFQLYKSGVLSGACGTSLDHGVLLVGYGTTSDGTDYWLVKNSWGPSWGMHGYVEVLRGKRGPGECGLKKQASYPVVSGSAPPAPPSPSPAPSPSPPAATHYEKPPCRSDETQAELSGTDGSLCAPSCDTGSCPTDVPPHTRATPKCILQDASSGKRYCALSCMLDSGCPSGASCARVGGLLGVCTYPESHFLRASVVPKLFVVVDKATKSEAELVV